MLALQQKQLINLSPKIYKNCHLLSPQFHIQKESISLKRKWQFHSGPVKTLPWTTTRLWPVFGTVHHSYKCYWLRRRIKSIIRNPLQWEIGTRDKSGSRGIIWVNKGKLLSLFFFFQVPKKIVFLYLEAFQCYLKHHFSYSCNSFDFNIF